MLAVWIILAIVAVLVIFVWVTYNGLVTAKVRVDEAWSDIKVQLKRRLDLIPNLVETVKGYAKHEKSTFEDVVKARNAVANASTKEEEMKANAKLISKAPEMLEALQFFVNNNMLSVIGEEVAERLINEILE